MSKAPSNVYPSLDASKRQIRLVKLIPHDSSAETICCELSAVSLDDTPAYTALSYSWTKEPPGHTILLNGQPFAVRPNLFAYLQERSAQSDASQWIFIDALCINQADNDERSTQVSLMGDVYRCAEQVVAWLGPNPAIDGESLSQWRAMADQVLLNRMAALDSEALLHAKRMQDTFARPSYWLQLWIVQEVVLARRLTLQCGSLVMPEQRILLDFSLFPGRKRTISEKDIVFPRVLPPSQQETEDDRVARVIDKVSKVLYRRHNMLGEDDDSAKEPIGRLLGTFHSNAFSVRHDAVFGLLGLGRSRLRPDYDMSVSDLFMFILVEFYLENVPNGMGVGDVMNPYWRYPLGSLIPNFIYALMAALDLAPDDAVVALLLTESSRLFWGEHRSRKLYHDILARCYMENPSQWTLIPSIARQYALARSWKILRDLRMYEAQNAMLPDPDGKSTARPYSEWKAKAIDQVESLRRAMDGYGRNTLDV
ncbi:uncharacterized protein LTR77_008410 [Saxophila tyrrhenica]|uniref:Heterokaryon incompatibility domain-containing protein n=1 Tax=Saxophila tyrrhenica TaxID=1690608 RepID=A0AAV9P0S7_9PEZI|nr:hypothetical protein LTR77_008410 [Saxophila tyrrhenica]